MKSNGITTFTIPVKSVPIPSSFIVRQEGSLQITEAKKLTSQKARKILHDKSVNGHPLTDKQRKFFGAISGGAKPYKESIERLPWPVVDTRNGQTIFESNPGHKGRPGQRGGSAKGKGELGPVGSRSDMKRLAAKHGVKGGGKLSPGDFMRAMLSGSSVIGKAKMKKAGISKGGPPTPKGGVPWGQFMSKLMSGGLK